MRRWRLALALVFAAAGCAGAPPPSAGKADLPDPLAAGWQGEKVCELLEDRADVRILRCTFPPGVGHERHFHPPHFACALSGGVMRLTDASGVREASPQTGSFYWSDGVTWHEALNVGATTVQYLMIEPKS
jgi:quercetin dioxygenase-like cupin family protein